MQLDAQIYTTTDIVRPKIIIEKQPTVNLIDESWDDLVSTYLLNTIFNCMYLYIGFFVVCSYIK